MDVNGYCIAEAVISAGECDLLTTLLRDLRPESGRAGIRNLMAQGFVRSLTLDPRLMAFGERICGHSLLPYKAMLFNKNSKANWLVAWHQDTALPVEQFDGADGWSAPSHKAGRLFAHAPPSVLRSILAIRIHLDASTPMNGPLRVIPGSHRFGILSDKEIEGLVRNSNQVECLTGRGGVVAMRPLLLHASSKLKSDAPRRVLHIEYAESLQISPGVTLAIS